MSRVAPTQVFEVKWRDSKYGFEPTERNQHCSFNPNQRAILVMPPSPLKHKDDWDIDYAIHGFKIRPFHNELDASKKSWSSANCDFTPRTTTICYAIDALQQFWNTTTETTFWICDVTAKLESRCMDGVNGINASISLNGHPPCTALEILWTEGKCNPWDVKLSFVAKINLNY